MVFSIIQVLSIFLVPVLIIKYHNFVISRWLGTIGTAYVLGILVALLIFALNKLGLNVVTNSDVGEIGSHLAISIAIPLLLFSANLKEAKKLSKTVLLSFGSLIVSAVIVSAITFYVYGKTIGFGAELSAMAVGLYTGGTPNLNAIGNIFGLDGTTIGVANLSDMVIGAVFYIFLLLLAKPLLSKILRKSDQEVYVKETSKIENIDDLDIDRFKLSKELVNRFFIAFGIALLGAGLGIIVWMILGAEQGRMTDFLVPVMMVTVTVLGIAVSFNEKIRKTEHMNVLGQYFILVFSFALASSLDFTRMQGLFNDILVLYGVITVGVFVLHIIISKFLNVDVDCTIVTLTAGLYGPAFVPAITKQIKNDDLTVPGLITGSIGYAIGTFLGILLGLLFLL
jgi:uncharacterized membrane protein